MEIGERYWKTGSGAATRNYSSFLAVAAGDLVGLPLDFLSQPLRGEDFRFVAEAKYLVDKLPFRANMVLKINVVPAPPYLSL